MLGYGHDESAPTPDGVFAPYFVGGVECLQNVLWVFRRCLWIFHGVYVGVLQSVRHVIGSR